MNDASLDLVQRFHQLSPYRQQHILRVAGVGEQLAWVHGLASDLIRWAAFGHDLAREMARDALLTEATRLGLPITAQDSAEPLLLHGPVAAQWLQTATGNKDVAEAIRYHTTAGPGLGPLAKALFIADGVEPGRRYSERADLWRLALDNLEVGYGAVLRHTAHYLQRRGLTLHPLMVAALHEVSDA